MTKIWSPCYVFGVGPKNWSISYSVGDASINDIISIGVDNLACEKVYEKNRNEQKMVNIYFIMIMCIKI